MVSIILVSHGPLASALAESVAQIAGKRTSIYTVELHEGEAPMPFEQRLDKQLLACLKNGEVIVVSDLVLGTPFNSAVHLMERHSFRHLTGMSSPMLLALLGTPGEESSAEERCHRALHAAVEQTMDVSELAGRLMV